MYILNLCREFKSELLRRRAIGYIGCRPNMCTRSAARFLGTIDILLRKLHIPKLRLLVSRYIRFLSRCRFTFHLWFNYNRLWSCFSFAFITFSIIHFALALTYSASHLSTISGMEMTVKVLLWNSNRFTFALCLNRFHLLISPGVLICNHSHKLYSYLMCLSPSIYWYTYTVYSNTVLIFHIIHLLVIQYTDT